MSKKEYIENKLNYLTPFKQCVIQQFPFIEEDFDAVTNYQLLCKVVEYLNKVIANENEVTKDVSYLINWFNNLDVQDEINNKLDIMAQDGTLEGLLNNYLHKELTLNTMEDLKNATFLRKGNKVKTLGFYSIGDFGVGEYEITDTKGSLTEDNGSCIKIKNDLYAILIYKNDINVCQFGAKGNNSNNDTQAFQQAIDFILSQGGGKIYVPEGKYKIDTINILKNDESNIEIIGDGKPIIYANSSDSNYLLNISGENVSTSDDFIQYVTIKNIIFNGLEKDLIFARLENCQYINFENVVISFFNYGGMILKSCWDSNFYNTKILFCNRGENVSESTYAIKLLYGDFSNSNANKFENLHIEHCPRLVYIDRSCNHNEFVNSKFEQGAINYSLNYSPFYIDNRSWSNMFSNCDFVINELANNYNGLCFIKVYKNGDSLQSCLQISNSSFIGGDKALNLCCWLDVDNSIITSCVFNKLSTHFIPIQIESNSIVSNCDFRNYGTVKNIFNIKGSNNQIKNNFIYFSVSDSSSGYLYYFNGDYTNKTNNIIENNTISGSYYNDYPTVGDLNGNYLIDDTKKVQTISSKPYALKYQPNILILDVPENTTISNIYGCNDGQKVTLMTKNTITIKYLSGIITKTKADVTLNQYQTFTMVYSKEYSSWFEI